MYIRITIDIYIYMYRERYRYRYISLPSLPPLALIFLWRMRRFDLLTPIIYIYIYIYIVVLYVFIYLYLRPSSAGRPSPP